MANGWSAGPNSEIIKRFLSEAPQVLCENGKIQMLLSSAAPFNKIIQHARSAGYQIRILAQGRSLGLLEQIDLLQLHWFSPDFFE